MGSHRGSGNSPSLSNCEPSSSNGFPQPALAVLRGVRDIVPDVIGPVGIN
ncbi:hypothetical protein [Mycolicibacterium fortuitum]|nr:hypothetical protein [Mycolicibacterium fortuitum]